MFDICERLVFLSLSLSQEVSLTRELGRGFTQADHYCLGAGISLASVLALNLSRHDRNRAGLS